METRKQFLLNTCTFIILLFPQVTQSYSKNHDSVGVIFASIVNFSEFYEESYEGGKECYRVLNELIGDFDDLLHKPEFKSVEKIKTIGSTYMAASGLNVQQLAENEDDSPHAHLRELFNFALEMMGVLDDFNKNMLGFGFKLRIGFNHGPLTAGVIGTTKLLYDIWGDTVNIASRMDSTGVECRVQVSEESHAVLRAMGLEFDYRGTVNVKGKGQMRTFLYPKSGESTEQVGPPPVASMTNNLSGSVSQPAALPPSTSSTLPPSSISTLSSQLPSGVQPPGAGPEPVSAMSTEVRDEGYRDAPHPLGQSPNSDIHTPPCSNLGQELSAAQVPFEMQPAPLALEEVEYEEEEAGELTKLNEEFYARLWSLLLYPSPVFCPLLPPALPPRADGRCGQDVPARQVSSAWVKMMELHSDTHSGNSGYEHVFHTYGARVVGWVRSVLSTAGYNRKMTERGARGQVRFVGVDVFLINVYY